ncbi:MAG: Maf family protein [Solirubrobacteraceae bacterium]
MDLEISQPSLILASRSPQRRAILEQLGIEFSVVVPNVEELVTGPPYEVAAENAYRKAAWVLGRKGAAVPGDGSGAVPGEAPGALILGVDTLVCRGSQIYGKPAGEAAARATLRALAGRRHAVLSGLCLIEVGPGRRDAGGGRGGQKARGGPGGPAAGGGRRRGVPGRVRPWSRRWSTSAKSTAR